jgi:metal-sulfur cluster biosynthetic enzyme
MLTQADIRDALRACYASTADKRTLNIVDFGLVESIQLTIDPEAPGVGISGVPAKHRLALTLLAPSDDQDVQAQLSAQIANCLAGLPEVSRTLISFATTPQWTPARISPEGRRLLQLDFPILNNRIR